MQEQQHTDLWAKNNQIYEEMKAQRKELVDKLNAPNYEDSEEIDRKIKYYIEMSCKNKKDESAYFQSLYDKLVKDKKDDDLFNSAQKQSEFHGVTKGAVFNKKYDNNEYISNFDPSVFARDQVQKFPEESYDKLITRAMKAGTSNIPLQPLQTQQNVTLQIKNKNFALQMQNQK